MITSFPIHGMLRLGLGMERRVLYAKSNQMSHVLTGLIADGKVCFRDLLVWILGFRVLRGLY